MKYILFIIHTAFSVLNPKDLCTGLLAQFYKNTVVGSILRFITIPGLNILGNFIGESFLYKTKNIFRSYSLVAVIPNYDNKEVPTQLQPERLFFP